MPWPTIQTHMQLYRYTCITNHNDDSIKTSDTVLLEKYTSHFIWKGCVWEGVGDRTELQHIDPHDYGHQRFFSVLQASSTGGLGPSLSTAPFSNWSGLQTNRLPVFTELYNSSTPTFFLWASQIALLQRIHDQGYNILIERTNLLFTKVHFLFW